MTEKKFDTNKRIRKLRDHLKLGRAEFAEKTGLLKKTIENLEQENQLAYSWHCEAICNVWPEYAYWLTTGKTIPEAGQISPDIEEVRKNLGTGT
jgi:DNA-binding XRE family transcriptional regulator